MWVRSSALLDAANLGEWIVSIIVITVGWAVQSIIGIETGYIDRGIRHEQRDYNQDGKVEFVCLGRLLMDSRKKGFSCFFLKAPCDPPYLFEHPQAFLFLLMPKHQSIPLQIKFNPYI